MHVRIPQALVLAILIFVACALFVPVLWALGAAILCGIGLHLWLRKLA
jgi:hypothetical protein